MSASDTETVPTVEVVHCIDTEGPFREPLDATFQRLKAIFGLDLEPGRETLRRLQAKEVDLGGLEDDVARVVDPHLLDYLDSWRRIDDMLTHIMSPAFRGAVPDSYGNGWVYNWHCVDMVGFTDNPRQRDMGMHNISDHYREMMRETKSDMDGLHFHHHPVAISRHANHSGTHLFSHSPVIYEILARKVIDRMWFPCVYRPGYHVVRADTLWFLEQFIPFCYANQSNVAGTEKHRDLANGRMGDWRRAPRNWTPYNPHHDDYQAEGNCRTLFARCLNVGTRHSLLSTDDVDQAFREAAAGKPVILAFTDHDFRDMTPDVEQTRTMIAEVAARHPGVRFRWSEGRDAFRRAFAMPVRPPIGFELAVDGNVLRIKADADTFGPQPFLALKTLEGRYFHDNCDIQVPFREWTYVMDEHTVPHAALDRIGVAACDATGNVTVSVMRTADAVVETVTL